MTTQTLPPVEAPRFDLFISYATDPDYTLAKRLKRDLELFHTTIRRHDLKFPNIRICVDGQDFRARPVERGGTTGLSLSDVVIDSLERSRRLLVLCSANARTSENVRLEIEWFLQHRTADEVVLAVTEGPDPQAKPDRVFPKPVLDNRLHERLWYDLRGFNRMRSAQARAVRPYDDVFVQLAAHVAGLTPSDVRSAWLEEQAHIARVRLGVGAALATVLLLATIAGYQWRLSSQQATRNLADAHVEKGDAASGRGEYALARAEYLTALSLGDSSATRHRLAGVLRQPLNELRLVLGPSSEHPSGIMGLAAVSATAVALADQSGSVRMLHLPEGSEIWRTKVFDSRAGAIAFDRVSNRLAVGSSADRRLMFLDAKDGRVIQTLQERGGILALRFSPRSKYLAIGFNESAGVKVVDQDTKDVMDLPVPDAGDVQGLAFSNEEDRLLWGGSSNWVWSCSLAEHTSCRRMFDVPDYVYSMSLNSSGRFMVVSHGATIEILDNLLQRRSKVESPAHCYSLDFDATGQYAIGGCSDFFVRVWDVRAQRQFDAFAAHQGEVYAVAKDEERQRFFTGALDGTLVEWHTTPVGIPLPDRETPHMPLLAPQSNTVADIKPITGDLTLVATWDGQQRMIDADDGRSVEAASPADTSRYRKALVESLFETRSVKYDGVIVSTEQIFDAKSHEQLDAHILAISRDGERSVGVGQNGLTASGQENLTVSNRENVMFRTTWPRAVAAATFLADSNQLAVADGAGDFGVINLSSEARRVAHGPDDGVRHILADPIHRSIWLVANSGVLSAWDDATLMLRFAAGERSVEAVALSRNGKWLAVGDLLGGLHVLDAETGRSLVSLAGHQGAIATVAFSPDSRRLYSGGADEVLRTWDVERMDRVLNAPLEQTLAMSH